MRVAAADGFVSSRENYGKVILLME